MTITEVLVAGIVAALIALAAVSMYIGSMETWDQAGARLALQRDADMVVEQIQRDVRSGSRVVVGNGGTSITITLTTVLGTSTIGTYQLSGTQLQDGSGNVLLENIDSLSFSTSDNVTLKIQLRLEDDMGTSAVTEDDEWIYIETAAVCRNR